MVLNSLSKLLNTRLDANYAPTVRLASPSLETVSDSSEENPFCANICETTLPKKLESNMVGRGEG